MGKGRAPCCDKSKVKRGPWSPSEDLKLITFIQKHGHENWRSLPKEAGLLRCGKSCRLRWINYLRPDVKRGNFTAEEEDTIILLHHSLGNKWSKIAACLPGRTDNEIKNVWNTHLKKRLTQKPETYNQESIPNEFSSSSTSEDSNISNPENIAQMGSSSGSTGLNEGNINSLEMMDTPDLLEIPFDSETDIWSLLDGLDSPQQFNLTDISPKRPEAEDEFQRWFKHLENELGLENNQNQEHVESLLPND